MSAAAPKGRLQKVNDALGRRSLVWFGTRGTDALPLSALRTPKLVCSQIAPIADDELAGARQHCLESARGQRKDLDRFDIDNDLHRSSARLKQILLQEVGPDDVLIAYRPSEFLAAALFCQPGPLPATNFHLHQRQFEYKPWVERELVAFDPSLPMLRWTYIRSADMDSARELLAKGRMVARNTTGSGGADVFEFSSIEEFEQNRPRHRDHFVGVARFVADAAPLNVNACVYHDGSVAVFGVSYQLIGISGLTRRRFGFGGNDYLAASSIPENALASIAKSTTSVGHWLGSRGYRGVFGIDFLLEAETPLITEVNARFQASTPICAGINIELGMPDPMSEHVAAFIGLSAPKMPDLVEQGRSVRHAAGAVPIAHVMHRNVREADVFVHLTGAELPAGCTIQGLPQSKVSVEQEGMLFKSLHSTTITTTGYDVSQDVMATRELARTRY